LVIFVKAPPEEGIVEQSAAIFAHVRRPIGYTLVHATYGTGSIEEVVCSRYATTGRHGTRKQGLQVDSVDGSIQPLQFSRRLEKMIKTVALASAILAGSASAFAPALTNGRISTAIAAEKSQALPFMNRPPLVS